MNAKANSSDVYTKSATDTLLNAKANSSHTHSTSQVSGLSALLAEKAPLANPSFTGSAALPGMGAVTFDGISLSSILSPYVAGGTQTIYGVKTFASAPLTSSAQGTSAGHLTRYDYVNAQVATKANATHTHAISDVTNLQSSLDAKAASSHTHTIANITNLQSSLDAKAASSHTHTIANVTGLQTAIDAKANDNEVVKISGNYTISGTKTFTGDINVPTPSTATQAANKAYVDSKAGAEYTYSFYSPGGATPSQQSYSSLDYGTYHVYCTMSLDNPDNYGITQIGIYNATGTTMTLSTSVSRQQHSNALV